MASQFITAAELAFRRQNVSKIMKPNSLAVFGSNKVQWASKSVFYPFRQDPDYSYLTALNEPDSALVIANIKNKTEQMLFVPEKNIEEEKWEGRRLGTKEAAKLLGIEVHSNSEFDSITSKILKNAKLDLYGSADLHRMPTFVAKLLGTKEYENTEELTLQRMFKSSSEIELMKTAGEISAKAYNSAYKQRFSSEQELQHFLTSKFVLNGCQSDAYYPVVAGGSNGLTIHYVENCAKLNPDETVLVDAAGRYGNYCADISRTWPINGKFTDPQRDLYSAVLATQLECINRISPKESIQTLHKFSEQSLRKNLKNIGLDVSEMELSILYPHMIGHHLGLDVHDPDPTLGYTNLEPSMVITVEPGVYVPSLPNFPKHFHNLAVRIEDNLLVTEDGCHNLTSSCLKEVNDISV